MNIREISDVFKNTASEISALKSYNFGWASDRVRVTNAEDFQDLNLYPRLFFSVPTIIASDQTRKQDTYQVTLFFDDLLGYDNEGDEDATMQIDKWATLQNYATAFIQRLNLIKQSILPNYIFIPEAPQFTFDSFTGLQRLITVQVNFNLIVPTNCEVIVQRVINVIGNVIAQGTTSANIFLSNRISASVEAKATVIASLTTGQNVVEVESSVTAFALSSGDIVRVQTISSDVNGQAISDASLQKVLSVVGDLNASGQVNGNIQLTLFVSSSVQANGNVDANIDVISQGVTTVESIVIANAITDANIQLTIPLSSSSSTEAITEANATLTKIIEASSTATAQTDSNAQITISVNAFATATAQTSSDAQLTLAVNANATATANTSANAQLSYTVNAAADATAQTSADAFITRIISADATATANSSAEAGIGVTFVAAAVATATSTSADLFRIATIEASVTGSANVTAATVTTVDNVAASVGGAATVSATLTSTAPLLLDLYPNAAAAYSLRKLRTAYTGSAIRVRANTSGAEGDVSFDENNTISASSTVTVTAVGTSGLSIGQQVTFSTFWNAGGSNQNVFVTTWYDQSGGGNNLTQSTAANQPRIVNSGTIITTLGGKPTCEFSGNQWIYKNWTFTISQPYTNISVNRYKSITVPTKFPYIMRNELGGPDSNLSLMGAIDVGVTDIKNRIYNGTDLRTVSNALIDTNYLWFTILNSTNSLLSINNVNATGNAGTTSLTNGITLGTYSTSTAQLNGFISEQIIWSGSQSANQTGIQSNINTYYGIY